MFKATDYPSDKKEMYALLLAQAKALMEGERHPLPHMANLSALLYQALSNVNWSGFYLVEGETLMLGPFCGKPACLRIPKGKGVCGTAWATKTLMRIEDVHQFPGHIACDGESNSEIVLPLTYQGNVLGVLDIDSPIKNRFDAIDEEGLQTIVSAFLESIDVRDEMRLI